MSQNGAFKKLRAKTKSKRSKQEPSYELTSRQRLDDYLEEKRLLRELQDIDMGYVNDC